MKCPNCGKEIKDGYLYCENCGMEIQIVPDFEPEIENSILETLSTVAGEIKAKPEQEGTNEDTEKPDGFFFEEPEKNLVLIKGIALGVAFLTVFFIGIILYLNFSVSHQVERAKDYAKLHNYEKASERLDRALRLDPGNTEAMILQSGYYDKLQREDEAVSILLLLLEKDDLTEDERNSIYYQIITIYHEQECFEEINSLLEGCQYSEIVTTYQSYLAMEPEFSYEAGSYENVVYLKLSANTSGKIYYTLDGSVPTRDSNVYTAPIYLESGYYQVNAFFVNEYGIASGVVKKRYDINVTVPDKPQVIVTSGRYEVPTLIEVLHPIHGKVYYTTDGSEPTVDSTEYTEPIPMPLGHSNFKFVVISEQGVSSDVVSRSYEFKFQSDVTVTTAITNVVRALINRDVIKDMQGTALGKQGKYSFVYNSIVQMNETYYYVLDEFFEDQNGYKSKSGLLYAVEVYTGAPNRLIYDEQGQMGLIPLTD